MRHRPRGKTGIKVGDVGIGSEYLDTRPDETAAGGIHAALERMSDAAALGVKQRSRNFDM